MRFFRRRSSTEERQTSNLVSAGSSPVGGTIGYLVVDDFAFKIDNITLDATRGFIVTTHPRRPHRALSGPIELVDPSGKVLAEGTQMHNVPQLPPGTEIQITYDLSLVHFLTADGSVPAIRSNIIEEES